MYNHLLFLIRSFLGVYPTNHANVLQTHDNGSISGNKSYVQNLFNFGQPFNSLLSKNLMVIAGSNYQDLTHPCPATSLTGTLFCYGRSNPFQGWKNQQYVRSNNNITKEEGEEGKNQSSLKRARSLPNHKGRGVLSQKL